MKTNNIYKIVIFLSLITLISCKTNLKKQIIKELEENSLLVLNDKFIMIEPIKFIESLKVDNFLSAEIITSDSIDYKNSFKSIIKIYTDSTIQKSFEKAHWIDYLFVKKVNPENKPLYMLDGMPMHDYNSVYRYLTKRIITKLNFIPSNQAIAIWGKREGQNGAIQIWTEKKEGEMIVPVIIK